MAARELWSELRCVLLIWLLEAVLKGMHFADVAGRSVLECI